MQRLHPTVIMMKMTTMTTTWTMMISTIMINRCVDWRRGGPLVRSGRRIRWIRVKFQWIITAAITTIRLITSHIRSMMMEIPLIHKLLKKRNNEIVPNCYNKNQGGITIINLQGVAAVRNQRNGRSNLRILPLPH